MILNCVAICRHMSLLCLMADGCPQGVVALWWGDGVRSHATHDTRTGAGAAVQWTEYVQTNTLRLAGTFLSESAFPEMATLSMEERLDVLLHVKWTVKVETVLVSSSSSVLFPLTGRVSDAAGLSVSLFDCIAAESLSLSFCLAGV